jgi:hypothetical protein
VASPDLALGLMFLLRTQPKGCISKKHLQGALSAEDYRKRREKQLTPFESTEPLMLRFRTYKSKLLCCQFNILIYLLYEMSSHVLWSGHKGEGKYLSQQEELEQNNDEPGKQ